MDARDYLALRSYQLVKLERNFRTIGQKIEEEVANPRLKAILYRNREATGQQIHNLERVVTRLGGEERFREKGGPMQKLLGSLAGGAIDDRASQAIWDEYKGFLDMKPPRDLIDLDAAFQAARMKHLEISAYSGLIALAEQLGETEIVQLLRENRQEDQALRDEFEGDFRAVLPELVGPEGRGRMAA